MYSKYFSGSRAAMLQLGEKEVRAKITALTSGDIVIQYDGNQPYYMDVPKARELILCIEMAILEIETSLKK